MISGSKCHKKYPVACDSYVKYEEAGVDRLPVVAIFKSAAPADCVEYSKQPASATAA